jgi:predicted membrane chloride channel (bestrophin family)
MWKIFKRTFLIINWKTIVITFLSIASTAFCLHFEIKADFPLTLIGTAIVFPIVFSIGGAYKRREVALDEYGSIKAHGRALYFAVSHWLENPPEQLKSEIKTHLENLLNSCKHVFTNPINKLEDTEKEVYKNFNQISEFIKNMRAYGLPSGEASRSNQFLSKMMISFERIKHIYQYRTPRTLRTYSDIFIVILPIVYGPHFAESVTSYSYGLQFAVPVLFSVILVALDNIQSHLENPFDQQGEDDVHINVDKFIRNLE